MIATPFTEQLARVVSEHGADVIGEHVIERIAEALKRGDSDTSVIGLLMALEVLLESQSSPEAP